MSFSRHFDQIAIVLSAVCIVHCLAVPLIVAAVPIVAVSLGQDSHFHGLMLWLVVPTSALGFALGYRIHRRLGIVGLGVCGASVLAAAAVWGHSAWTEWAEVSLSVAGSVLLAAAHWQNFRCVRRLHRHA